MDKEKIIQAGKIASQCKEYAKTIVKKGVPVLEIAEKIEAKIIELGGKPAFPVNTSINEIAAHYTPSHNDETLAEGLIKIDLGVHIDGWAADTAISFDLENSEENQALIESAKAALESASKTIKEGVTTSEIGASIEKAIESSEKTPVINLSGHQIEHYDLHAGLTIPNIETGSNEKITEGLYAVEPFTTTASGSGKVRDGNPSGIYMVTDSKNVRSPIAREILDYVLEEYETLPFCSRWLVKKFGPKALIGLRQLEQNGNLHHFAQLIESSNQKVAQAENSFLISEGEVIITTE